MRYASPQYSSNLYKDYCQSGLLIDTVNLSSKGKEEINHATFKNIEKIYCSNSKIAIETAETIQKKIQLDKVEVLPILKNIKHDFSKYIKETELQDSEKMLNVRKQFFIDLIEDNLLEQKSAIINRCEQIHELLESEQNALFITHGLMLVTLKIFLNNKLEMSVEELRKLTIIDFSKPFYGSLKGFYYPNLQDISFT